jgi:SET domain-containing protein
MGDMTIPDPQRSLFEVRPSPIEGHGVFATRTIRRGTCIGEYTGEYLTEDEVNRRYDDDTAARASTFLFQVADALYIDAEREGGAMRYVNHSCDPNCETEVIGTRVVIRAIRTIPAGQELTYDYALELEEEPLPSWEQLYACRCGAASCRGTMLDSTAPARGARAPEVSAPVSSDGRRGGGRGPRRRSP